MALTLDERVTQAKQRVEAARRQKALTEHSLSMAQAALRQAQEQLAAEFPGITTPEAAQGLRGQLESEAAAEVSRVEAALAAAGG
jgi:hypothetical protein